MLSQRLWATERNPQFPIIFGGDWVFDVGCRFLFLNFALVLTFARAVYCLLTTNNTVHYLIQRVERIERL